MEEDKEKRDDYYLAHKELFKANNKKYRTSHREKVNAKAREYHREHREVKLKRYCSDIEEIENYCLAKAVNFAGWDIHHRLETHTSDGIRRPVDLSMDELVALGTYYNRPASELVFMKHGDHMKLHDALHSSRSKGGKGRLGTKNKHHKYEELFNSGASDDEIRNMLKSKGLSSSAIAKIMKRNIQTNHSNINIIESDI